MIVKSNHSTHVLQALTDLELKTFDVASVKEMDQVFRINPDATIFFSHPVKSVKTIAHAYEKGVRNFTLDTMEELEKILDTTNHAPDLQLLIRIDPEADSDCADFPLKEKFGMSRSKNDDYIGVLQKARKHAATIGISFHVGSQCKEVNAYTKAIELAADMAKESGVDIDVLGVGGGFPIEYGEEIIPSIDQYIDEIQTSLKAVGWQNKPLIFEPGRGK